MDLQAYNTHPTHIICNSFSQGDKVVEVMEGVNNNGDVMQAAASNKNGNIANNIDQSNTKNQFPQTQGQGVNNNLDPKKLKRVAASREYSQRYRLKQLQYTAQLETGVRTLQAEVAITIPRIKYADTQNALLRAENASMKQKLSALSGKLMTKEAEYRDLKKERDVLKQLSLLYQAPAAPPYAELSQANHYNYMQVVKVGQSSMEAGGGAPPPPHHQNFGNQLFGSGLNSHDNNRNPM